MKNFQQMASIVKCLNITYSIFWFALSIILARKSVFHLYTGISIFLFLLNKTTFSLKVLHGKYFRHPLMTQIITIYIFNYNDKNYQLDSCTHIFPLKLCCLLITPLCMYIIGLFRPNHSMGRGCYRQSS